MPNYVFERYVKATNMSIPIYMFLAALSIQTQYQCVIPETVTILQYTDFVHEVHRSKLHFDNNDGAPAHGQTRVVHPVKTALVKTNIFAATPRGRPSY